MRSTVPLTPADIHNVAFGKAPIGKRGYNEEDVDALLDEVSEEMILLLEENEMLQRRAGGSAESEYAALAAELARAREACDQAEQNARALRSRLDEARLAAAQPSAPATSGPGGERVLLMAQSTADDHLREAHRQAESLLADARALAERTLREAESAMHDVENKARRHHSDVIAESQNGRTALLREIEGLARLAEDYRAALTSHLVSMGEEPSRVA
jgi:DivIVA domain-containing protein